MPELLGQRCPRLARTAKPFKPRWIEGEGRPLANTEHLADVRRLLLRRQAIEPEGAVRIAILTQCAKAQASPYLGPLPRRLTRRDDGPGVRHTLAADVPALSSDVPLPTAIEPKSTARPIERIEKSP